MKAQAEGRVPVSDWFYIWIEAALERCQKLESERNRQTMEQIPKIVGQRLRATAKAEVHPDPDLLAAFAEQSLRDRERVHVLEHLAQCADCRDIVLLTTPELEPATATSLRPGRSSWLRWPALRWGALAACVVVVGTAVTFRYQLATRRVASPVVAKPAPSVAPAIVADQVAQEARVSEPRVSEPKNGAFSVTLGSEKPQPKREVAAASPLKKQVAGALPLQGRAVADLSEAGQLADHSADSISRLASTAPGPAPAPLSKAASLDLKQPDQQQPDQQKKDERAEVDAEVAKATTQTVTVEAQAPLVAEAVEVVPGKAKAAKEPVARSRSGAASVVAGAAPAGSNFSYSVQAKNDATLRNASKLTARWTLSPDGVLQRSLNGGTTWETIPVAEKTVFRALASVDSDIWVGGAAGALYHSSDIGLHWTRVKPTADGVSLAADIIGVEFSDAAHGKLTTAGDEVWTTNDTGQSWQKK